MKKTPLYDKHLEHNGKIIDFGGWELPVEYSGILAEHEAVRTKAGLFDVSHMGEILVTGKDSEAYIQNIVTNDISTMENNQIFYSLMCHPDGGVVDDLLIYKYNNEKYFLVVNASNTEKDYEWILKHQKSDVKIENVSQSYAEIALQGPAAQDILQKLTSKDLNDIKFFYFEDSLDINGINAIVSRNGYTGEDGFEIYVSPENGPKLWDMVLDAGKSHGLVPAGLGARDTLRFEVCLPLYGQEISENITPLEAGLGFFVKMKKDSFIGKEALLSQKENGIKRKLAGFEMIDRGIARSHYDVFSDGKNIGFVTTGSYSPTLKKNIGLALINAEYAAEGNEIEISIRNKNLKAKIIKKPFYNKNYKK